MNGKREASEGSKAAKGARSRGLFMLEMTAKEFPGAAEKLEEDDWSTTQVMMGARIGISIAGVAVLIASATAVFTSVFAAERIADPRQAVGDRRLKLPVGPVAPAVSMGATHGIILASDGTLWSWGDNFVGWPVLAQGNVRTQAVLKRIGGEQDWVGVSSSRSHNLALKADGTIWAWGENINSQLGIGSSRGANGRISRADSDRNYPVPSVPGNDWKQIAAGGSHSVALKKDGTLWAWGSNWAGQLGVGRTNREIAEATQVGTNVNWKMVWAGGVQTVGLQSDGSLWFWGSLTGEGTDTNRYFVPTRATSETNWSDVGFGYFTVFAIKTDGTLWVWGRNAGIYGGGPIKLLNPIPVRVGKGDDWKSISHSGNFYHVLMKKDGSLWAMDASDYQVLNNTKHEPVQFERIDLQKDIVAYGSARRGRTGVAVTREGEVWTWGKVLGEPSAPDDEEGVTRDVPWQLSNLDPTVSSSK